MTSTIRERGDELIPVDYTDLLDKTIAAVKASPPGAAPIQAAPRYLRIDVDAIAARVARMAIHNPIDTSVAGAGSERLTPGITASRREGGRYHELRVDELRLKVPAGLDGPPFHATGRDALGVAGVVRRARMWDQAP